MRFGLVLLCYQDVAVITGSLSNGSYNWSNGVDGYNSLVVTEPGVYSATVTNEFGCTSQTNELLISAVEASTPPFFDSLWVCSGTDVNLQDSTSFMLNWYALDTTFLYSGSQLSLTNIQSDTNFLVAYDAGGCSPVFTPVFVGVINAISNFSLSADTMMCLNEQISITYQGDSNLNFQWFNGNTTSNSVIVNQPGTYTISLSQCEYQVIDSITIYDGSFSAQITSNQNYLCPGGELTLVVTPSNLSYNWVGMNVNTQTLTVANPGSYSVVVTNQFGCNATSNLVQVAFAPNSLPPVVADTMICLGSNVTLSDSLMNTINWYTNDTMLINTSSSLILNNLVSDTSFLVSQTSSQCDLLFETVFIDVIDPSIPIQIIGDTSLCPNTDLVVYVDAPGSFTWSLPNGLTNSTDNPLTIPFSVLQNAATISVSVQNQCFTQTVSDTIIYLTPDSIHLAPDSLLICAYDTVSITSLENVQDLIWTGNFGSYNSLNLEVNSYFGNGYIYAQGIDLNGCTTNTDSIYLTTSTLNYSIITDTSNQCLGDLGFINVVTSADSLVWNTPIGFLDTNYISIVYNSVYDGNYNLTLWDDIGCIYQETVSISYNQIPTFNLNDTIMCLNEVYQNYPIQDSLSYIWTNYGDTNQVQITGNQDIVLTAITQQGCYFSDTVHVVAVDCTDELPNVITANGDGINDFFVIDEAPKFPNNRLIILNRWGNVIIDQHGYQNDFDGMSVSNGIYFYYFYRNPDIDSKSFQSGFLHILH
ncbi:MAG: gliding motility-associated C-terminal domain-containing protein [Flavobacteriales bacterium]|nr:gliding motility-associated C-terminal domain-containing protein [Flavobacteriales bacterium]